MDVCAWHGLLTLVCGAYCLTGVLLGTCMYVLCMYVCDGMVRPHDDNGHWWLCQPVHCSPIRFVLWCWSFFSEFGFSKICVPYKNTFGQWDKGWKAMSLFEKLVYEKWRTDAERGIKKNCRISALVFFFSASVSCEIFLASIVPRLGIPAMTLAMVAMVTRSLLRRRSCQLPTTTTWLSSLFFHHLCRQILCCTAEMCFVCISLIKKLW